VFFAVEEEGKLFVETASDTEHSAICTPEQAIAATLGAEYHRYEQAAIEAWESIKAWNARATHGTLTAEQVRELIAPHLHARPTFDFGRHGAVWRADFQAIADELNAELGSGTCELAYGEDDEGYDGWYCQSCGGWFDAVRRDGKLVEPRRCGCCGKAVKR
jgi:hypothetical protein